MPAVAIRASRRLLRGGTGEFYGGNQIKVTKANDMQRQTRSYIPFAGKGNVITTSKAVTMKLVADTVKKCSSNPKYRGTKGVSSAALRQHVDAELTRQLSTTSSGDGSGDERYRANRAALNKAIERSLASQTVERTGSGASARFFVGPKQKRAIAKIKSAVRFVARGKIAKKRKQAREARLRYFGGK